jgi:hypothetical protein
LEAAIGVRPNLPISYHSGFNQKRISVLDVSLPQQEKGLMEAKQRLTSWKTGNEELYGDMKQKY